MRTPDSFPDPTRPEDWDEVAVNRDDVPWAPSQPTDDEDAYELALYAFGVLAVVVTLLLLAVAVPLTVAAWRLL